MNSVRRLARSFCLPGQRRWHFVHERNSRRRQIIDAIVGSHQVAALICHAKGQEAAIRAESLRRMVKPLLNRDVTRLVIESRDGRDHLDRQVLLDALRQQPNAFDYAHLPAHSDPLLWVADAIAWCSSAREAWYECIEPLVEYSQDVGHP